MSAVEVVVLSDDDALGYTQRYRRRVVEKIAPDGNVPECEKKQSVLLMALDGMDRAALAKKRMDNDNKVGQAQVQAAAILADVLSRAGNRNPFEVGQASTRKPDHPETLLEGVQTAPGEMDIGLQTIKYEDIVKDKA